MNSVMLKYNQDTIISKIKQGTSKLIQVIAISKKEERVAQDPKMKRTKHLSHDITKCLSRPIDHQISTAISSSSESMHMKPHDGSL